MLHKIQYSEISLRPKKQVRLHLYWVVYLNTQRYFSVLKGLSLELMLQSCLKNTMLKFKEHQQNISTLLQLFQKPLTKSWENSCLS